MSTTSLDRLVAGVCGIPGWEWDAKTGRIGRNTTIRRMVWRLEDGRWAWGCLDHDGRRAIGVQASRSEAIGSATADWERGIVSACCACGERARERAAFG